MKPKKSLGQNFLRSDEILSKIVNVGNINYNDTILEIGPGTGNLTKKILDKKPNLLIVVEKDEILSDAAKVMNIPKSKLKTAIANLRSKFGEGDAYSNRSSERIYHRAEHIVQKITI